MKKLLICCLLFVQLVHAQDDGGYKTPPKDIQDMLLAKPTPGVSIDDKGEWILFTQTSLYPSVEELAKPHGHHLCVHNGAVHRADNSV